MEKSIIVFSCVIFLLILTFSDTLCEPRCPADHDVAVVKLNRMVGEWYMVAGTPVQSGVGSCLHFDIKAEDPNLFYMNFTTTSYRDGSRRRWKVEGTQKNNILNATWQLSTSSRILGPFKHQVLRVDYDEWCAMIVCASDTSAIAKQRFGMIWSRAPTISSEILNSLKTLIGEYVSPNDILDVDNSCYDINQYFVEAS